MFGSVAGDDLWALAEVVLKIAKHQNLVVKQHEYTTRVIEQIGATV